MVSLAKLRQASVLLREAADEIEALRAAKVKSASDPIHPNQMRPVSQGRLSFVGKQIMGIDWRREVELVPSDVWRKLCETGPKHVLRLPNVGLMGLGAVAWFAEKHKPLPADWKYVQRYEVRLEPRNKERHFSALNMRKDGKLFREIGECFGVTASRAQQMVRKAERLKEREARYAPP